MSAWREKVCPAKREVCQYEGMILPSCNSCEIRIQVEKKEKRLLAKSETVVKKDE